MVTDGKHNYAGVVAFDLDGTLIRGIRHSWSMLWRAVGRDPKEANQNKKAFSEGSMDYQKWVQHDFETFRSNNISIEKINKALSESKCSLTKNLRKAILELKRYGYIVAIISGGVDSVLKYFIPNPIGLFDKVYINELVWDDDGQLKAIIPTPYDWDSGKKGVLGKCGGLKNICENYGIPLSDSVFVGDDENDVAAMKIAGRKVVYSADRSRSRNIFQGVHFEHRNDLMKVVDYIVGTDNGSRKNGDCKMISLD